MHPLLVGRLRLALYIGAWLVIGALLVSLIVRLVPQPVAHALFFAWPLTMIGASMCLSAWYVCKQHPLDTTSADRLIVTLIGSCLQNALVWTVIAGLWGAFLSSKLGVGPDRAGLIQELILIFIAGVFLYAESIAVHYVLLALESARAAERRMLESQVTAREAELRALRAQLNPHFLFNSLNSISALTGPDPEAARRMCQLLGDFLRLSLALGARERVALSEELELAERYLAIERVRFGERLRVEARVDPHARDCLVPPLLIQPLIENAVKHGVANRVDGGVVEITARRRGAVLELEVENPRDPDAPTRRGQGLGLENVRRRLSALDPDATRVEVHSEVERFRVIVQLPAVERVPPPTTQSRESTPIVADRGDARA